MIGMLFDDRISKSSVAHVLFNWSKLAAKSLQFPNHHIRVVVTGCDWTEVLIWPGNTSWLYFYGDSRVTTWRKRGFEKVDYSLNVKVEVEKVVEYRLVKIE